MFEDINLWIEAVDWTELWVNVLLFVIPPLVSILAVAFAGSSVVKAIKQLAASFRGGFDEATDPAIGWIAAVTKLPAETVARIAVAFFDAILTNPEAVAAVEARGWIRPYPVPRPPEPTPRPPVTPSPPRTDEAVR